MINLLHKNTFNNTSLRQKICGENKAGQCDKRFNRTSSLNEHLRTHNGEKPFKCTYCEKSFAKSSDRNTHTRIHTGEKPFKCTHCDKIFARKTHLVSHIRIHTREKPFNCNHCDKNSRIKEIGIVICELTPARNPTRVTIATLPLLTKETLKDTKTDFINKT